MKQIIFLLIACIGLSVGTILAVPNADYNPPKVEQTTVQSYQSQTDFDFIKNKVCADFEIAKMSVEKQISAVYNISKICTHAENTDIGYIDHIDQFRLCSLESMFDNLHYNSVCRYSNRYNIITHYHNSNPFIIQT